MHLEDAQGKKLRIGGVRKAQLEFEHVFGAGEGQACGINESFVLSDVTNTLVSFGRMLRTGWSFGSLTPEEQVVVDGLNHGQRVSKVLTRFREGGGVWCSERCFCEIGSRAGPVA